MSQRGMRHVAKGMLHVAKGVLRLRNYRRKMKKMNGYLIVSRYSFSAVRLHIIVAVPYL